jgi:hypothetical protein
MSIEHGRPTGGKVYLTSKQVRERYGNVSDMTIWRWSRDEALGFPQPEYINGRRYWNAAGLDTFDRCRQTTEAA